MHESISQNFTLILSINGNKNMRDSKMQRTFQCAGLIELSSSFSNDRLLASHILGSKQIDAMCVSPNINPTNLSILLHYFVVSNHRYFIIDFPMDSFIGDRFIPIVRLEIIHLTFSNKGATERYLSQAQSLFYHHKIGKKITE